MGETRSLVLASSSPYRRALLERLGLAFIWADPALSEMPQEGEAPGSMAVRLAVEKARVVAKKFPDAIVIGSDQVASLDGAILRKPGTHDNALLQLRMLSGRTAQFDTGVAVVAESSMPARTRLVSCRVAFRNLTDRMIEAYLAREQPFDCAGSAKAEALGIALITSIESADPTALIGLPLIALTDLLEEAGLPVLG